MMKPGSYSVTHGTYAYAGSHPTKSFYIEFNTHVLVVSGLLYIWVDGTWCPTTDSEGYVVARGDTNRYANSYAMALCGDKLMYVELKPLEEL